MEYVRNPKSGQNKTIISLTCAKPWIFVVLTELRNHVDESTHDNSAHDSEIIALLTEHQLSLRLYVRSLMPGDASAHDVTQQANLTLWKKRGDFELGTNFKAWAFSVARFEVLNYRKQRARDSRLVFSEELEKTFADELARRQDDSDQRQQALQHCISKLSDEHRQLIFHRYASSDKIVDYATRVGRSAGGLKVTLHRLRNLLLDCIRQQLAILEADR